MSQFDHSDLDGHLLQLLLAVHEEQSITRAAQRLGVTQSAVSHLLDKLRAIVGDPLFVRLYVSDQTSAVEFGRC